MSVLFLGKRNDQYAADAAATVQHFFHDATIYHSLKGEPFPKEVNNWSGDWIISYLCQNVVPAALLTKADKGSINFHPGPPDYPGVGCTNFAIYEGATEYGVTCHHMAPQVDSGAIVAVNRFPLLPTDTVLSLTKRSYGHMIALFHEITMLLHCGRDLPSTNEKWARKPLKLHDFFKLCELQFSMDNEEIDRRIRATTFPDRHGPYFTLRGKRFVLEGSKPIPLSRARQRTGEDA